MVSKELINEVKKAAEETAKEGKANFVFGDFFGDIWSLKGCGYSITCSGDGYMTINFGFKSDVVGELGLRSYLEMRKEELEKELNKINEQLKVKRDEK